METRQVPGLSKEQYPRMWGNESHMFESTGDYEWMANQFGNGSVLEIG